MGVFFGGVLEYQIFNCIRIITNHGMDKNPFLVNGNIVDWEFN